MDALKARIAAELDTARRRSLALLEPLDERALTTQHSPLMSPLVWDLAHVGNYEEQWLVRAVGGAALQPDLDDIYDAFRHARSTRTALPLLGPAAAQTLHRRLCATACSTASTGSTSTGPAPLLDARLRVRHGRPARAPARRDDAGHAAAHGRRLPARGHAGARAATGPRGRRRACPREVLVPAGTVRDGHQRRARGPTTTSGRRTSSTSPATGSTPCPSPTRPTRPSSTPAATATSATGRAAGWAWRKEAGLEHPQAWSADSNGGWLVERFGATAPRRAGRAGAARVLVRGRRVGALGRPPPADRSRVGEGGVVGPDRRCASGGSRGATTRPTTHAPTSTSTTSAPRRSAPTRPAPARSACTSSSATCGSGRRRTSRPTRASCRSRTASTARSSSAPTTRSCAAARGRPIPTPCAPRSATGTTRSAARSSPASELPATRGHHPMTMTTATLAIDVHLGPDELERELRRDVEAGLTATPKSLPPEVVLRRPRLVPVRLHHPLARVLPDPARAGDPRRARRRTSRPAAAPTRWSSWARARRPRPACCSMRCARPGRLRRFVPLDVSEPTLRDAAAALTNAYPGLEVHAVVGDFERHLGLLPGGGRRMVAFLGGTIGNLEPAARRRRSCGRSRPPSSPATRCCSAPTS